MFTKLILSGVLATLSLGSSSARADAANDLYDQLKAGNCQPALGTLQARAAAGEATFQNWLGMAYHYGTCSAKDHALGAKWVRKAAEQGNARAQYSLGVMYDKGTGVPKYERQAVEWYRKAAEQGHADAQYNLGVLSAKGTGMLKDNKRQAVE